MTTPKVSRLLSEAADLLERDGWTQGTYVHNETGCRCAEGAVWKYTYDRVPTPTYFNPDAFVIRSTSLMDNLPMGEAVELDDAVQAVIYRALAALGHTQDLGKIGSLIRFNDTPGRTSEQVIELLRKASEIAAEDEK